MLTQTQVQWHATYICVDVPECIQQIDTIKTRIGMKTTVFKTLIARIASWLMTMKNVFFTQGVVIEPLHTCEETVVVFLQFKIMNAFDDGRKGIAFLEI